MGNVELKTHLQISDSKLACGKSIYYNTEYSTQLKDITCQTCQESYMAEVGVRRYRSYEVETETIEESWKKVVTR